MTGMAEEKVSELLASEIRAETQKRLIRKLAEEGGGTWAAYMWMEIEQFFGRPPTPVTEDVVLVGLEAARDLAKTMEGLTGCRSDDDYVWGAQAKIDAAIAALVSPSIKREA